MTSVLGGGPVTAGLDPAERARFLAQVRDATLSGTRPPGAPRPVVSDSWRRSLAAAIDPEGGGPPRVFSRDEIREIRRAHPLAEALPLLRHALVEVADEAMYMMIVTDAEGTILWCEGQADVIRLAEPVGLMEGTRWAEETIGTNAMGTALAAGRPVQIHSAEHLVRTYHAWTCAASPVHDPDTGEIIGVVDVTGPAATFHPATISLVSAAAKLAESQLQLQMLRRYLLQSRRTSGDPGCLELAFLGTEWPTARLGGRRLRLSLRHAEMITVLALHPGGLSAEQLATEVYGDAGNPMTARAEVHRLRVQLGAGVVRARPYRLNAALEADFLTVQRALREGRIADAVRARRGPLLPRSESPGVRAERESIDATLRRAVIDSGDVDTQWELADGELGLDDIELASRLLHALPRGDPRRAILRAREEQLRR